MIPQNTSGFTLIELVMITIIISLLAAVALPNFLALSVDAKNSATQGALAGLRAAIAIAVPAIALKEAVGTGRYPTYSEMSSNTFNASHPVLNGNHILDASSGIPPNPWLKSGLPASFAVQIFDCSALAKGGLLVSPNDNQGWCYNENTGQIWANSSLNGGAAGQTENFY